MALQKAVLKTTLKAGFIQIFSNPQTSSNVNTIAEQLATLISNEVDLFVKTGEVTGADSGGDTHNLTIQ